MSQLQFTVKTKHTAAALKATLENQVLTRSEVLALLHSHRWEGNILHAAGAIGSGTLSIRDFAVDVSISLSMMGSMARSTIQQKLTRLLESPE